MYQILTRFGRAGALSLALLLGLALTAPAAWSQEAAGRFIVVVGEVKVVDPSGSVRLASTGANLMTGDTVVSASRALAQLRLADGSLISVRADTRFTLEEFSFRNQTDRLGRMFINLVQGSLRSITGLIGRTNREGFRLDTPHATIGVRGTDFETAVFTTPRHGFVPGTLSAVFEGGIFTRNDAGIVDTGVGKAVFVASRNAIPRPLPSIPEFMLQGGAPRAEVSPGTEPEPADKPAAAGRSATGSIALPAVQKGTAEVESSTKVESATPLLINPLLTPISPTTTTKSLTTETTKSLSTTISPTTTEATKSLSTTISPTTTEATGSLSTTVSPTTTEATKSISTTISPLPTSPTTTTVVPKVTSPTTTVSPTIKAPVTSSPSTLSPATKTDPKLTVPLKR